MRLAEEFSSRDTQGLSQPNDDIKRRVSRARLKARYVGAMQIGTLRELLLRPAPFLAEAADTVAKGAAVSILLERVVAMRHQTTFDASARKVCTL